MADLASQFLALVASLRHAREPSTSPTSRHDGTRRGLTVNAPVAMWGDNILTIEEEANAREACTGILLKSMDQNTGRVLEAFYPPLGDPRIVTKRPNAKRAPTETDLANAHYLQFNYFEIQTQTMLDERARSVYEQFARQELEGTFTTAVMYLDGQERPDGSLDPRQHVSIFD
ncbi:MAG TPA: hypothetical protein VJW73_20130, partial [Gemmatimonadaceae bacterium]|nr:hypothetical protein [Gemmatimonadaceae bacterium]